MSASLIFPEALWLRVFSRVAHNVTNVTYRQTSHLGVQGYDFTSKLIFVVTKRA